MSSRFSPNIGIRLSPDSRNDPGRLDRGRGRGGQGDDRGAGGHDLGDVAAGERDDVFEDRAGSTRGGRPRCLVGVVGSRGGTRPRRWPAGRWGVDRAGQAIGERLDQLGRPRSAAGETSDRGRRSARGRRATSRPRPGRRRSPPGGPCGPPPPRRPATADPASLGAAPACHPGDQGGQRQAGDDGDPLGGALGLPRRRGRSRRPGRGGGGPRRPLRGGSASRSAGPGRSRPRPPGWRAGGARSPASIAQVQRGQRTLSRPWSSAIGPTRG